MVNVFKTETGKEMAFNFNANALLEIAEACESFGNLLVDQAKDHAERKNMEDFRNHISDCTEYRSLAAYCRRIIAAQER